jgi:lipid-binding SYLF domain-containing protein
MMKNLRVLCFALIAAAMTLGATGAMAATSTKSDLERDSSESLAKLTKTNALAASVAKKAKAVLIFPSIVKAGLVFGGAYGEGVLRVNDKSDSYYNSITGSFGWQAGAQSYGYVVFLMNDKAVKYIHQTNGWEIGVGPTVMLVNEGVAKNLSSTSLQDDAYAFIFDQKGLMASLSIEGTKISRIKTP